MTYRSSKNQIANLKPREPKGGVTRDVFVSAKITSQRKAVLVENLKACKMSFADLLEAIGEKLEQGETLEDILKN